MPPYLSISHCAYSLALLLGAEVARAITPASFAATKFDVVIVGGGTAGLVLANRLSSHSSLQVGVIDAGIDDPSDPLLDIPYGSNFYLNQPNNIPYFNPKYDWSFFSVPQESLGGTVIAYNRGKVLGGSSAINLMVWQRGAKVEYDAWGSAFGNGKDWTFSGLLPYFERAENWTAPPIGIFNVTNPSQFSSLASVQGEGGPVSARYTKFVTDIEFPLTEASQTLGFPLNNNPDGGQSAYLPRFGIDNSVDPNTEKRSYAAPAYYGASVRARSNLQVLPGALATRLLWDPTTLNTSAIKATGVEFTVNGTTYVVNATKEIILSAGSLKSPQILELSGVGNATLLKSFNIPVVLDFPQIGENLVDHPISFSDFIVKDGVLTLDQVRINATYAEEQRKLYDSSHEGAFTFAAKVTGSFPLSKMIPASQFKSLRSQLDETLASLTLTPMQRAQYTVIKSFIDDGKTGIITPGLVPFGGRASPAADNTSYFSLASYNLHEFSRGYVHLNSSNPNDAPIINPRFGSVPWDLQVQVIGQQFVRTLAQTAPLSNLVKSIGTPSANTTTDADWTAYIKSSLGTIGHPIGTTVMASKDLGGVVDPKLKVYGLANVRVVDAGIIPLTIGCPIQQTVYAIAEKASDIICSDLKLK